MSQSLSQLRADVDRLEKKLKRKKRTKEEDQAHALAVRRVEVAKSRHQFILSQCPATCQSALTSILNQQVALQEQIATLQERARYWTDLAENREEHLSAARTEVANCEKYLENLTKVDPLERLQDLSAVLGPLLTAQ